MLSFTSSTRHSKIAIVDLPGIAFKAILIPSINFDLSQMMFMWITPFKKAK